MNVKNKLLFGITLASLVTATTLWEGTRYTPYLDLAGVPTVCQGYTGKDIDMGKRYSQKECAGFLSKELAVHSAGMLKCIDVPLIENQYIAYMLFTYNVGISGFCGSRARALLNKGLYTEACKALSHGPTGKPAWSYVGDTFTQGLYNRRRYETALCLKEDYVPI